MRDALVNGIRQEAEKGARGKCLCCGANVIAKCGSIRCNHWAHENKGACNYSKKELKTQWHIDWQNYFPQEWQETRCVDGTTGEVHIADIKTPDGLVVEFQHSYLEPKERFARERYHKSMIWMVDGTKFKKLIKNFTKMFPYISAITEETFPLYTVKWVEKYLPERWLAATVPLYYDFRTEEKENADNNEQKSLREPIWGFFRIEKTIVAVSMSYNRFVDHVQSGDIRNIEQYVISTLKKHY